MKTCRLCLLGLVIIALAGCDTVNRAMLDVQSKVASIDLSLPGLFGTKSKDQDSDKVLATNTREPISTLETGLDSIQSLPHTEAILASADCPEISMVSELKTLHQFKNPNRPRPNEKISSITIDQQSAYCEITGNQMVVDVNMKFQGQAGGLARLRDNDKPSFSYPYFVAITTPAGNIIAKEVHAITVSYNGKEDHFSGIETIRQTIPLAEDGQSTDHSLLIGFQLSPGELAYNRSLAHEPVSIADNASPQKVKPVTAGSVVREMEDLSTIEPASGSMMESVTTGNNNRGPVDITAPIK